MDIKGKKVLIIGFGKSGQAAARYCLDKGAQVTVTDVKNPETFDLRTYALTHLCTYFGSHPPHIFNEADVIVVSPGVPLELEGIQGAKKRRVPIIGEMELVLDEFSAPIIAITGTNGKSTVTTLIGGMIEESGRKVCVGGNLGTPLADMLSEAKKAEFIVLEISSYQLEITPSLHPHIAVLLNITEDHLDRYDSFKSYVAAKALITKNLNGKDYIVFNEGDSEVVKIAKTANCKKIGFSLPTHDIDFSRAKITGLHNKENMLVSAMVAEIIGCSPRSIQRVVENFSGLPHRNQFVREVGGVKYYDDSKGTNVGAVVKSLEGFDSKVVLIAGGLDKRGSYDPLKKLIKEKVRACILIGEAREAIAKVFNGLTKIIRAGDMAAAVREAAAVAVKGDVVLLSPACASFDMFKDYAHRGEVFVEEVNKL